MKEVSNKNLTPAQEKRLISLFNDILNDEQGYLQMVLTFQAMQKQYLLSYLCDGLGDAPKDNLHVVLDRFSYILSVPAFEPNTQA